MTNGNKFPTRVKTVLDDPKLKLSSDKLPNGESRPNLQVYWTGNNPRIDVRTNVPNDKGNGLIRAAIDVVVFNVFLDHIIKLCDPSEPPGRQYCVENKAYLYPGGVKSKEPVHVSTLIAGKDKEGRIYLSLISTQEGVSKVLFRFGAGGPFVYHILTARGPGEQLTPADVSIAYARAWVVAVREFYFNVASESYEHKTADAQGGNKQGGQQRTGGYNKTYEPANDPNDFSDDLPFG